MHANIAAFVAYGIDGRDGKDSHDADLWVLPSEAAGVWSRKAVLHLLF